MTRLAGLFALLCSGLIFVGVVAVSVHDSYPLPDRWNPFAPLDPAAPETALTGWQLARALGDPALCRAALARGGAVAPGVPDRAETEQCHLRDAVALRRLSTAALASVTVPCPMALRLLMWERHDLQPAAARLLGSPVAGIEHFGAYSCRRIRTGAGTGARMSLHATGEAIDMAGFRLQDGRQITLAADWSGAGPEADFLRAARDTLCRRFPQVLGPAYNALHRDHFHVAVRGGRLCR